MTRLFLDVETYSPGPRLTHDDRIIAIACKPEGGQEITFNRYALDSLGIGVEGILIVSDLEV